MFWQPEAYKHLQKPNISWNSSRNLSRESLFKEPSAKYLQPQLCKRPRTVQFTWIRLARRRLRKTTAQEVSVLVQGPGSPLRKKLRKPLLSIGPLDCVCSKMLSIVLLCFWDKCWFYSVDRMSFDKRLQWRCFRMKRTMRLLSFEGSKWHFFFPLEF